MTPIADHHTACSRPTIVRYKEILQIVTNLMYTPRVYIIFSAIPRKLLSRSLFCSIWFYIMVLCGYHPLRNVSNFATVLTVRYSAWRQSTWHCTVYSGRTYMNWIGWRVAESWPFEIFQNVRSVAGRTYSLHWCHILLFATCSLVPGGR